MNSSPFSSGRARALLLGLVFSVLPAALRAQAATGAIEGRVLHAGRDAYLENVRLTVEGTALTTFTASDGSYRLDGVPAGNARVVTFYTGLRAESATVAVTAGAVTPHDFKLTSATEPGAAKGGEDIVRLSQFTVASSREMDGAAYAINEQRVASSIKNVVSTEEFGAVAEGNIGEFLKFLPGVSVDYVGGNARSISINGVPPDNVPVTLGGLSMASSSGDGGRGRSFNMDFFSTNNLSRVELEYSPTAESPGSALAGTVNLVPRSAFERTKPLFNYSLSALMRDNNKSLSATPGPRGHATNKIRPGADFSYSAPVNKSFGYTISAGSASQFSSQDTPVALWRGASAITNGVAFPHTTPDLPYLSRYSVEDGGKFTTRLSLGITLDFRLTQHDRISVGFHAARTTIGYLNKALAFQINQVDPAGFSLTSTRSRVGTAELNLAIEGRERVNKTAMPTLFWYHRGPVWKFESAASYSSNVNNHVDVQVGRFFNATTRRTGLTIAFDDIQPDYPGRPERITVTDGTTGAVVDPYSLSSYSLATANSTESVIADLRRNVTFTAGRDFRGAVPFSLKAGLNWLVSQRDNAFNQPTYNFVGADGRASTTPVGNDDSAARFLDPSLSQETAPFGFPLTQRVGNDGLYQFFQANPAQFTTNAATNYISKVNNSRFAREMISAAFLRGDAAFLDNRLKFVGGLRAEQTNIDGQGPLNDPTRNYQRDASGRVILGTNGRPVAITSDALASAQLTRIFRGTKAKKEYLTLFPSLNASYALRENLTARAAYYHSIGRPNFDLYTGGVTLPDTESQASPTNVTTVANIGIKPWTARTKMVRLEYYFPGVGVLSAGAFRRDFQNFWAQNNAAPTSEFLALYGLDPAVYGKYDVATQYNLADSTRVEGFDINYKQALTFLPQWARGVQVFGNLSRQRVTGGAADFFSGYQPKGANWGISLTRPRYNLRVNFNYQGQRRQGAVTATGTDRIGPSIYNWRDDRLYIDVLGEVALRRSLVFFFNLRNVNDQTERIVIYGPQTPASARFRQSTDFAALWTFGVKGTF
ncbi:MAG: TonB-dependent receptor plug domain-containing protein [Verrucomicrobia bacterium]|nr:TonB-dependent receptor plug domain-containing protein [Verrucomicrobiota bacterium]